MTPVKNKSEKKRSGLIKPGLEIIDRRRCDYFGGKVILMTYYLDVEELFCGPLIIRE